jgi:hypothetical protein
LHLTNLDLLTLAPATYLIVVAPLLMRDETLPSYRVLGQGAAVLGAILLLMPALWLSFANSDGNLLYTLILMGEALVLLLGGIGARIRVFVLSGTGLMLIGAIHALFLTTSGIPTPSKQPGYTGTNLAIQDEDSKPRDSLAIIFSPVTDCVLSKTESMYPFQGA